MEEVYCDACGRSFKDERELYLHQSEHETCGRDGCTYSAHPKLVAKHVKMQHDTGLYKRIGKLNTEEDIAKWVAERKRRYPTKKVVEEKKAFEEEKVKRGERIKEDDNRFNKKFSKRERKKVKTFKKKTGKKKRSCSQRKNEWEDEVKVEEALKEEASWRGSVPPFQGIRMSNEDEELPERSKPVENFSDDEWEATPETPKEAKPVSSSLGLLAACYDSNVSDDEDAPEEVKTVRVKENCSLEEKEANLKRPQQEKRRRGRSKRCKTDEDDKDVAPQCESRTRKRELTLLEKLLSREIRHERNIILQCVRYVINNNFFIDKVKTTESNVDEAHS